VKVTPHQLRISITHWLKRVTWKTNIPRINIPRWSKQSKKLKAGQKSMYKSQVVFSF